MVSPLRVAFAGAARRSQQAAQMLVDSGIGVPTGFWNRTPDRADSVAASFGVPAYADLATMVESSEPDLVAVITHPAARATLVETAVRAGARAVLVEKPLALTAQELAAVERAAGDAFVAVNTQYQFMPHWRRYLDEIADGALGNVHLVRVSVGVDILEQGPHALSLAMAVADAAGLPPPTWVLAASDGTIDFGGVSVPASTSAVFDLGDARLALQAGACAPPVPGETIRGFQQQTEISGERGHLWVSLNQGARLLSARGLETTVTCWDDDDYASQTGLFAAIAEAVDSAERMASFPTRLEVAARQTRLLLGAIEAATRGDRLSLD